MRIVVEGTPVACIVGEESVKLDRTQIKTQVFYVRLSDQVAHGLRECAAEQDLPVSSLIRHAIANWLIEEGKL